MKKLQLAKLQNMFFDFILQLTIILALVIIIYIFARKNPLVIKKEKQLFELVRKIDWKKYFILIKEKIQKQFQERQRKIEIKKEGKSGVEMMIEEQKYIQIISKDPKNIFAYQKLGKLYLEQKNYDDAKAAFEQVLTIDPENERAKEELEKIRDKPA